MKKRELSSSGSYIVYDTRTSIVYDTRTSSGSNPGVACTSAKSDSAFAVTRNRVVPIDGQYLSNRELGSAKSYRK